MGLQSAQSLALLFCALLVSCGGGGATAPSVQTTAYYIDSIGGSDSNSGRDAAHPWQSLSKASSLPVPGGSAIYLKRGSVWYEQLTIPNSLIAIDAYGDGALSLPRIDGSRLVGAWTNMGGGIYSALVALNADEGLGNLSEDGAMLSFVAWDTDAATTLASAANGTYSYSYPDTLYIKRATAPSGVYRASVKFFGINAVSRSGVIVNNVETTRFSLHGISFKDCIRREAHGAVVSQGGGAVISALPVLLYAGNGIEFDNNSTNGVVDGVAVSEIFDSCISPQTYVSGQSLSGITIKNSQLSTCGFAGVEVSVLSNGGTTGSSIANVTLSGLTIVNAGKGWSGRRYGSEGHGIRIKADTGAGSMSNVQIDTTRISGAAGNGVSLAGEIGTVKLSRMSISSSHYGIDVSEASATSLKPQLISSLIYNNASYGIHYDSPSAAGLELYQNTFSDNGVINLAIFNQAGVTRVQNNIFYGSSAMTHLYSSSALSGAVIDHNCYNELANMFAYNAIAYSTVTDFKNATTCEAGGLGGIVGLTNPAAGNFALAASSQCKSLGGSGLGVTADYSGYLFANPPSSGAYQYR